jgi:hypothetical protein
VPILISKSGATVKRRKRRNALRDRRLNDLRLCCPSDPFNPHRRIRPHPPTNSDSCSTG